MRPRLAICATLGLLLSTPDMGSAQGSVDDLAWLGGCWVARSGEREIVEAWLPARGGLMIGVSRSMRGDRATGYEFLLLHSPEGVVTYTAHPSGQTRTDFRAVLLAPGRARFENAEHDFPQALEYVLAGDSLLAHVYGSVTAERPAFSQQFARRTCWP